MDGQQWEPVTIDKRGRRGAGESSAAALARAGRSGAVASEKKFAAGENRHIPGVGLSAKKLEEDTEHFVHATVDRSLSQAIQQARLAKKLTQKELAVMIMEKPTVIQEYESGRAIPNPTILSKLDRALGVHLPRPPKKK